jgi:hypothetical protein
MMNGRVDGDRRRETNDRRSSGVRRDDGQRAAQNGNRRKSGGQSAQGIDFLPKAPPTFEELHARDQQAVMSLCRQDGRSRTDRKSNGSGNGSGHAQRNDRREDRYAKCRSGDDEDILDCSTQMDEPYSPESYPPSNNKSSVKHTPRDPPSSVMQGDSDRSSLMQFSTASTIPANASIDALSSMGSSRHNTARSAKSCWSESATHSSHPHHHHHGRLNAGGVDGSRRFHEGARAGPDQLLKATECLKVKDETITMSSNSTTSTLSTASFGSNQHHNDSLFNLYNNLYDMVESGDIDQYGNAIRTTGRGNRAGDEPRLMDTANRVVDGLAAKFIPAHGANGWRVEKHEEGRAPTVMAAKKDDATWAPQNQLGMFFVCVCARVLCCCLYCILYVYALGKVPSK